MKNSFIGKYLVFVILIFVALGCGKPTEKNTPAKPKKTQAQAINDFSNRVHSLDSAANIVLSVEAGDSDSSAIITVTSRWHYMPKGSRLELAKAFQNAWSYFSEGLGSPFIEIYDQSGNKVGGTNGWGDVFVN